MIQEFSYKWEPKAESFTVIKLKLIGALDRSIDPLENQKMKDLKLEFDQKSKGKIVVIDVESLDFWDTEGVEAIVEKIVLPAIQKSETKVGFFGKKVFQDRSGKQEKKQVYDEASLKYEEIGKSIPWEESEDEVINSLRKL